MNMPSSNLSLIIRLPNWVGDVVMAVPVLQALNQLGIKLYVVGKPWIQDLLRGLDLELIPLSKPFWQAKKTIATIPSDKVLLLTNSLSSALIARLAGKVAIGYKTDSRQLLLNASLNKLKGQHEVQYFWDIARFACQTWFAPLAWPQQIPTKISLPLNPAVRINTQKLLKREAIESPFWVLCPFAHGTGKDKKPKIWPHWPELSKHLSSRRLIVCPGKNEEHLCNELTPEAHVLTGLNLGEYACVLAQAERVIANDSGPMHIAAAVGAKTFGIFGVSDPERTAPWGADYIGSGEHWPTVEHVLNHINRE